MKIEGTSIGKETGLQGQLEPMKSLCFVVRLVLVIFLSELFLVSDSLNNKFGGLKTSYPRPHGCLGANPWDLWTRYCMQSKDRSVNRKDSGRRLCPQVTQLDYCNHQAFMRGTERKMGARVKET